MLLVLGVTGIVTPVIEAISSAPASAQTCSGSGLSDDFTEDYSLSSCWVTGGSLLNDVASAFGRNSTYGSALNDVAPTLSFHDDLDMQGSTSAGQFTGIQSADEFSAPLQLNTSVEGIQSHGSTFVISLVNATATEGLTVDANLPAGNTPYDGIYANNAVGAAYEASSGSGNQDVVPSPSDGVTYDISMSIDSSGNGTVSISAGGGSPTSVSVGNVGTSGSYYIVLGQWQGSPAVGNGPNEAAWYYAALANCGTATSFTDDFAADSSLSSCWQNPGQLTNSLAQEDGSAVGPAQLSFGSGAMQMSGTGGDNDQTGILSTFAYSPPFELTTSVAALVSSADPIDIYLLNSDLSKLCDVEADLSQGTAQGTGGQYGIYASDATEADYAGQLLYANPQIGTTYAITLSVDASGNATASVNGGPLLSIGNVGTGPFFVLLGQRAGYPDMDTSGATNVTDWYSASLAPPPPPTWSQLSPATSPPDLTSPAMAYDAADNQLLLVGEDASDDEETWTWNGATWQQLDPGTSPPGRSGDSMAYDAADGQVVLFGGQDSNGYLNDTWTWNGSTWAAATPSSSPSGRVGSEMAYDYATSQLVLFGGAVASGDFDDTWVWGGSNWTQTGLTPPGNFTGRYYSEMAYTAAAGSTSGQLLLFSGFEFGTFYSDTWSWTGSEWTQLTPESTPTATGAGSMYYDPDPSVEATVMFGGNNQGYGPSDDFGDDNFTYDWTDSTGSFTYESPAQSPPAREYAATAYDAATDQLVLFGGENSSGDYTSDTWTYGPAAAVTTSLSTTSPTVAGVEEVPATAVPTTTVSASSGSGSGDAASAPLSSIPLSSIGLSSSPLSSIPLSSIPLSSIALQASQGTGLGAAEQALSSSLLSDISITFPSGCGGSGPACTGWAGVLAGTPYESVPLESVTLADVLGDPTSLANFDSVDLGSLDLSSSPLSSIPLSSIELGATPLSSIGLNGSSPGESALEAWCADPAANLNCADLGIDPNSGSTDVTLLSLALAGVPLSSIPLSSIPLSSIDLSASPLSSIPLSSIPLSSIPLSSIPLSSIPLSSIPLGYIPLSSIPLSSIPLSSIPLSSIPVADQPAIVDCTAVDCATGTLGSAYEAGAITPGATVATLASDDLDSIPLSSIPLSSIPLSSIPLSSISLSSTPLSSIPLSSIPLSSIPLGSLPLSSIPLSSIPLGSLPLSSIPLSSIPLGSIPLSSIPLSSIPLGSVPLSSIGDLSAVVDCSTTFACTGATLGQASAAGALASGATLADVGTYGATTLEELGSYNGTTLAQLGSYNGTTLGELGSYNGTTMGDLAEATTIGQLLTGDTTTTSGYPNLTLGDLILSTEPPASYAWNSVSLPTLPLAADETAGGTVTYTADVTVGSSSTGEVTASLPPTFAYVPGSTTLDGDTTSDPTSSCVIVGGQSTCSLSWSLPLASGENTLTFGANAGIGLGSTSATLTATVGGGSSTSSASVEVVDGEAPAVNSASTPLPLTAGTPASGGGDLNIGYLTSPGDLNDWSVNVTSGEELSLALTNLPGNYDLELFGPSTPELQGTPSEDLSGVTDTLPSLTPSSTAEATPGSQDLPITPPAGDELEAVSNNPDEQDQYVQTPPLAAGTYIVQVSGYNGAFSAQPYLLRAALLGGVTAPTCSPISYPYASPVPSPASGPVNIPAGVNTLFLVDTQRLSEAFGSSAEETIMGDLEEVATDSGAGVIGAVIPVDAYASVQAAYATWNSNPCSVTNSNAVVAAIAAVVDQIRADNPTIQNLVIVGADDQIPFARIADGATQSNERDYGTSTFAGENNVEADALSEGYYFSDDPYAADQPLGVGSATLYTPELGVGRLVENATEIESALTRFVSSDGDLDATAGLTTGYSFLTSGAEAVSANLAADGLATTNLIDETWTASELDGDLAPSTGAVPGVDSLNAHFDYSRALPAYDNTNNVETNLFTTADLPASTYAGRLLFSMGCHAGLDIDDAEVSASGITTPVADWAKTFADAGALWVANTGYGYADTDTLAYSAKLMADFAGNLNGSLTIGEALTEAKQQYGAGNAILSPYDLKALMESTLYGLPMYNLNTSSAPVSPPSGPPTTVVNSTTGLTDLSSPISLSLGEGTASGDLGLVSTANGDYYQVNGTSYQVNGTTIDDGSTQTTEYRPIEPLATVPVSEAGLLPHGALVTGLTSSDTSGFTPAYSMPAAGAADSTPPEIGEAAFPGTLQRVATYSTFTSSGTGQGADLDLVTGQFLPSPSSPGTGTERLFTSMSAQVYYLPPTSQYADDYTPATIDSTSAVSSGTSLSFTVDVTPSAAPVTEVLVLYTNAANPGSWTPVVLSGSGDTWSETTPSTDAQVQYIVEALDAAGNVAVSNNEGTAFNATPQASVSIALSGNGPSNGYYTGPVTADFTAPSGSTYVLDGGPETPVPAGDQITVSSSGEHTLTLTDPDGTSATQAFAISSYQTTTTLAASSSSPVVGQQVTLTATVAASTSGVGSPGGNVEFLDGTTPVSSCGGSTGSALSGTDVATCTVSYLAAGSHEFTASYLGTADSFASSTSSSVGISVVPRSATISSFTVTGSPATFGTETNLVFSATVTAGDSGAFPSGDTVTVTQGRTTICTIQLSPGSGSSANSGSGSCSPLLGTVLGMGTYSNAITATFNSTGTDPTFLAAAPATTTVKVLGSTPFSITVNGSASSSTIAYGSTATLAESGLPPGATGTVTFTSGNTTLCTLTYPTTMSCATSSTLAVASYPGISATFVDTDGNYGGATSTNSVSLTVNPASSTFTLTVNGSSSAAIAYGSTATLAESGLPSAATGTVSFKSGSTTLCSFTLSATTRSCTTSTSLPAGSYAGITGTFASGNNEYLSGSSMNTVLLTVSPANAPFTVAVNGGSSAAIAYGSTATLSESGLPSGATGSLVFTAGHTTLCTITYPTTRSCTTSTSLPAGSYSAITASFTDTDGNYSGSTSTNTVSLTVNKATPVLSWTAPAAITYGTPLSATQLSASASVPGTFSFSPAAGTVLQPGTQTLTATFTPTDTTDYVSGGTVSTTISVVFTQSCITTKYSGSLTVAKGQAACIGSGGSISGSVSVAAGGSLWVSGATIGGSLSSSGALGVTVCGTKVTGSFSVSATKGPVVMGGSGCAADTVTGSVSVSSNTGGVILSGNGVTGSVAVSSNSNGASVTNNTISGSMAVTNNTGPFLCSGNTVKGSVTITGNS